MKENRTDEQHDCSNEDNIAKDGPAEAQADDGKWANNISKDVIGKGNPVPSIAQAQVSHFNPSQFECVDDLHMPNSDESENSSKISKDAPVIANVHLSPRGAGDCSIDAIIALQNKDAHVSFEEVDELNLVIDITSQINEDNVNFSKSKTKKKNDKKDDTL